VAPYKRVSRLEFAGMSELRAVAARRPRIGLRARRSRCKRSASI